MSVGDKAVVVKQMPMYCGTVIEGRGQVVEVSAEGMQNEKLFGLGYLRPLDRKEETTRCLSCSLEFTGSATAGPYKEHLTRVRHDLNPVDLTTGSKARGKARGPDTLGSGGDDAEHGLELEGAPPVTKDKPGKREVSLTGARR